MFSPASNPRPAASSWRSTVRRAVDLAVAFATLSDELPRGHCFPAAHASSGYALVAFYFALRERHAAWARCALLIGLATGLLFGIAQQARGAHFLSHDVWSAFLVWMTTLTLYTSGFITKLAPRDTIS